MALLLKQLLSKSFRPKFLPSLRNVSTNNTLSNSTAEQENKDVDPDTPIFDMENPYTKEKLICILCRHGIEVDYKNVKLLSQFQSPYTGRIYGRHITGLCKAQQEKVENEIIKSQGAGLMGYYNKDPQFIKDPLLFDPERPIRPHRF